MVPIKGAIESFKRLSTVYDTYILSTSPWDNPTALNDKLDWIKRYLGDMAYKRAIFTHHKHLNKGDYLIDDRTKNSKENSSNLAVTVSRIGMPYWHICCDMS